MDSKTVNEALELQSEFSAKLSKNLDLVRAGRKLTVEGAIKDKQRQVERAGSRLQALGKNREEAIARLDRELERSKADLERLQDELKTLQARGENPGRDVIGPGVVVRDAGEITTSQQEPQGSPAGKGDGPSKSGKKKSRKPSKGKKDR